MPMIIGKDLREKTDQELLDQLAMEKKKIFDATVRGASGEAIKAHEKKLGRRLVARIRTILRERGLRAELDRSIAELKPKAESAQPKARKLASSEPRVQLPRVRLKNLRLEKTSAADRAAVRLAEARRVRKVLERVDPGQSK